MPQRISSCLRRSGGSAPRRKKKERDSKMHWKRERDRIRIDLIEHGKNLDDQPYQSEQRNGTSKP